MIAGISSQSYSMSNGPGVPGDLNRGPVVREPTVQEVVRLIAEALEAAQQRLSSVDPATGQPARTGAHQSTSSSKIYTEMPDTAYSLREALVLVLCSAKALDARLADLFG